MRFLSLVKLVVVWGTHAHAPTYLLLCVPAACGLHIAASFAFLAFAAVGLRTTPTYPVRACARTPFLNRETKRSPRANLKQKGKAEGLEPCFKAMDLLNSALELHEDMRSGTKPVPLGGEAGRGGAGGASSGGGGGGGGGFSGAERDRRETGDSDGGGPPRAGGEHRGSEDLRDFLSTEGGGAGAVGAGAGAAGGGAPGSGAQDGSSSAASLRLYQLPAVREACGGFDPKRCIGEGGFGKVISFANFGFLVFFRQVILQILEFLDF